MYGPTETTVWSTTHKVARSATSVPIGRPVANTIDLHSRRRWHARADWRGRRDLYRRRGRYPGLLAAPRPDGREICRQSIRARARSDMLYRTGDLVRYRDDGEIEFIGRTDQQVKIRGFRIELGEIETVLGAHPAVNEAVVVARRDRADNPQLAAYVVVKPGLSVSQQELKIHARKKLPDYMIPPAISFMSAMPLTPNGKTDRKALPDPNLNSVQSAENHHRPSTELEGIIVELWKDALGLDAVGLQVNLFDLGANSLSVAEVATSLRQELEARHTSYRLL